MSALEIYQALRRTRGNLQARAKIACGAIPAYWWAGHRNFGDLITPFLVKWLTGRPAVNLAGSSLKPSSILCSTGSILHGLDRRTYEIWGSGFIAPQKSSPTRPVVHALRGPLSGRVAKQLGWEDPGRYCDPGLILPLTLPRPMQRQSPENEPRIALVPHYALIDATTCNVRDVRFVNPCHAVQHVVPQISDADYVISSSLHGLILAQAYGRPWVWLRDHRSALEGGDFKFFDFFESLGVSPIPLEIDGTLTRQAMETAIGRATLASKDVVRARQFDLLDSAPSILAGVELEATKSLI